tara:strand:+ start:1142 stop:1318 length:177 start_codon:yes stop_codon:yes gene_type:complete
MSKNSCVRDPDPDPRNPFLNGSLLFSNILLPEWGSDLEYDSDTLAGAGYGTDEDYGGW